MTYRPQRPSARPASGRARSRIRLRRFERNHLVLPEVPARSDFVGCSRKALCAALDHIGGEGGVLRRTFGVETVKQRFELRISLK